MMVGWLFAATCVQNISEWKTFQLTHVVFPDSLPGLVCVFFSLLPHVLVVSICTAILLRRELHLICLLVGLFVNECFNWFLKEVFKEMRPCLGDGIHWGKYGMPSNHTQFMFFFSIYGILFFRFGINQSFAKNNVWVRYVGEAALFFQAAGVLICRVYLQYHTVNQVLVGMLVGSFNSLVWFCFVQLFISQLFPFITQCKPARSLMLRDSANIPNVIRMEYEMANTEYLQTLEKTKVE